MVSILKAKGIPVPLIPEKSRQNIDVSIIIPNYNSTAMLNKCLDALFNQDTTCNYEIIVVDSSDKPEERALLDALPDTVKQVHLKNRTYPGIARNIGVEYARGDIIAFTDSDCIPAQNWVESICVAHQKYENSLIGGGIGNGTPGNYVGTAEYMLEFGDFIPSSKQREVESIPTCNFSIRRDLFVKVGKFENVIKGSDTLFSHQFREKGYKIYFIPSILLNHVNRCDAKRFFKNQRDLGRGGHAVRRDFKSVPGHFLTKNRIFPVFILPFKTYTFFKKALQGGIRSFLTALYTFPLVFGGLFFYVKGFLEGFRVKPTQPVPENVPEK